MVSICAVGDVARDVEPRRGGEFCFVDGCYVYVVVVEEQGEFCFLGGDGVSVPGYDA